MKHRLAAAKRNDAGAQFTEFVDAAKHFVRRYRRRGFVKLVAVSAGQITAPDWNDLGRDWMMLGGHGSGKHLCFAPAAPEFRDRAHIH